MSFASVTDEHGEVIDPTIPKKLVHDEATYQRWQICQEFAATVTEKPYWEPETILFATEMFQMPIPTYGPEPLEEGQNSFNPFQWRDRYGRWIDMPDAPRIPRSPGVALSPGSAPEPDLTIEEIRAAGLLKAPKPGPAAKAILGDHLSTYELYGSDEPDSVAFPNYATDRAAAHDALIADALAGKHKPDGNPHALFMAGGTASGKTTVLRRNREALAPSVETTVHVDMDEIKNRMGQYGMPEYDQMRTAGDRYAATAVHKEAGDIARKMIREASQAGLNVIIDGTGGSDPGKFKHLLSDAHDAGYTVDVLYVNRPTDDAIKLAVRRSDIDGRFVPVPDIRRIHMEVSRNYRDEIRDIPWLNSLVIYDQDGPVAYRNAEGEMVISDQSRYDLFVDKANENPAIDAQLNDEAPEPQSPGTDPEPTPVVPEKAEERPVEPLEDTAEVLGGKGESPFVKQHPKDEEDSDS